jgi:hypothetical protein
MAQNVVQRDSDALTILTQTIAAGGGQELLASVQDFTETGTVTHHSDEQVTGSVIVKGRGLRQFEIVADLSTGNRITLVNGEGGFLKDPDGRSWPIHRQVAVSLGSFTLPCLPLIAAIHDSSTSIAYVGLVNQNGIPVYDVRLQKVYSQQ